MTVWKILYLLFHFIFLTHAVHWSLTYRDTFIPQSTVRITEYPDTWVTFSIYNHNWFPNMCPDKWIFWISEFRTSEASLYLGFQITDSTIMLANSTPINKIQNVNVCHYLQYNICQLYRSEGHCYQIQTHSSSQVNTALLVLSILSRYSTSLKHNNHIQNVHVNYPGAGVV